MKRKIIIIIFTIFFFLLSGCNSNKIDVHSEDIYQLAVEAGYIGTYEEWLETIKGEQGMPGENGKEVLYKVEDGYIKWQHVGDDAWINLVELTEMEGDIGVYTYELYKQYNPDYVGSEEEWFSDLINGRLPTKIKVSLNLNGGQFDDGSESILFLKKGEIVKLPIPSKTGYMFTGWYTEDGEEFNEEEPLYNDIDLKAGWQVTITNNVSIKFRVGSGKIYTALLDRISEFEELYPNINVNIESLSGGYDNIEAITIQDINNNNAPDIIIGYPEHLADYYSSGALVNLQQFIDLNKIGYSDLELNDFVDDFLNENRGFNEEMPNDLYGLPFQKSSEVLVYNKTFFEELFGTSWETKIPKTWAEYEAVGQEILTKISNGEADNIFQSGNGSYLKLSEYIKSGDFVPLVYDSSENAFITMTHQFGGLFTERVNAETGYVMFDNEESRSAMTYLQNLKERNLFSIPELLGERFGSSLFTSIKSVMCIGSTGGVHYNSDKYSNYNYEIGVSTVPYYLEEQNSAMSLGVNIAMLNQNTDEEKLASWFFIKFLMNPYNTAQFAMDTGGYLPVRKSAYETNIYQEYLKNPPTDKIPWSKAANVVYNEIINKDFKFIYKKAFVGYFKIHDEGGNVLKSIIIDNKMVAISFNQAYSNLRYYIKSDDNET